MIDCFFWTGQYECVCGGSTTGKFCQECLPMFNQIGYLYGRPCEGRHKSLVSVSLHYSLGETILDTFSNNSIGHLFQNATATIILKRVDTTLPWITWTKVSTRTGNEEEVASVLTVRTILQVPIFQYLSFKLQSIAVSQSTISIWNHVNFVQETTVKCVKRITTGLWEGYKRVKVRAFLAIVTDQEF